VLAGEPAAVWAPTARGVIPRVFFILPAHARHFARPLLTFFKFSFLYLSKGRIYGFETLRSTETLQLEHNKNSSEFFVQFKIFKHLKFKRIS
jgi:hypothetical protein